MNKQNIRDFSCERTGQILSKEKRKVYDKKSEFYGNDYFKLEIALENKDREKILFVYANRVSKKIFETIEQSNYIDKRYLFFCEQRKRGLVLNNWRELSFNFKKEENILENYEKK
ncbi:MAG: hypothetical protein mread185_000035 [Mycoplasmataceae bacterium]|nr:MAG: hypothetical protein mread185_000035 [Mycoplasmataceae bacterium]